MGSVLFILLAAFEIAFVIWANKRGAETKRRRMGRLIARTAQVVIVLIAMALPYGQKWRLAPALVFLAVLLVIAGLRALLARKNPDGAETKRGVGACVFCILFIGLFLAPAFVFTGYNGLPVTGPYTVREASAILSDSARTDPFEDDGSAREVPVHFYYPDPDEAGSERFPLVIFSHGAFGYYQSNTSTYTELASHGYVVAALDHPHHAFFTHDTDGQLITVDPGFMQTALTIGGDDDPDADAADRLAIYREWMTLRTEDISFVLDALKAAAQSGGTDGAWTLPDGDSGAVPAALGETDVTAVGLMGHSMGGAASVAVGRERGDVTAVVDIDGTMLGEYLDVRDGEFIISEEPYETPVLEFNNWTSRLDRDAYLAAGGRYPNDELLRRAAAGYSTSVRDTEHMDFTDLPLLSPFLGSLLGSGARDTAETMTIVNGVILDFFDCYLKGGGEFSVQEVY